MQKLVCPGSFDPVTNGHIDVFERAAALADEVVVAVLVNSSKKGLFAIEERVAMLYEVTSKYKNIKIETFNGLLVDFCKSINAQAIVKGLRAVSDFDYELQMSQMNYQAGGIDTLFIATNPVHSFLSSSLVKEFASLGGNVSQWVPPAVETALQKKFGR
ncbi:MAG: pantetheine-phosphate adenylyltransferase [Candidatus Nanopelagicales bacterium]|jgi:pantetheine-phosphate adenylyltransferase